MKTLENKENFSDTLENKEYDLVIIGGGPCGLALAHCCSHITNKILIIEKENTIGGCHRVRRVQYDNENLFTEHGPRVYSKRYKNMTSLLNEMNVQFDDLFKEYNFNISQIGSRTIWNTLEFKELFIFGIHFLILMLNPYHGRHTSMSQFVKNNNFKNESIEIIDRICRLTDGADIERYTLNEFLQLVNQHAFYKLYQPKIPNDIGLFNIWEKYLTSKGIDIKTNINIKDIQISLDNSVTNIILEHSNKTENTTENIRGKKFVFAIPPKSLYETFDLINSERLKNSFGDYNIMKKYSENTAYIDYISITFHWKEDLKLPKIHGFPRSYWGIVYIMLSDYMNFKETNSKTTLSVAITINRKSLNINKTPDECSKEELFDEVLTQLREVYPNLPKPSVALLSPGVKFINNKWKSIDTAFVTSAGFDFLHPKSKTIDNMYTLGTHNGYHNYPFTSIEAAITNSIKLSHIIYPELEKIYDIKSGFTIRDALFILVCIIIIYKISQRGRKINKLL